MVVEHQAVLAGAAIGVWALARVWPRPERWRLVAAGVASGVVALLPLAGYNLVAFGTLWRVGYQGVVGFEGMSRGVFGLTWPSPGVLWAITLGAERGLFWVAPVLVLVAAGLIALGGRRDERGLAMTAGAVAAIVLLVNSAYVYWDGGNSTGPRHAMPVAGPLALGLAVLWAGSGRAAKIALGGVLAVSIVANLGIAVGDVMAPPGFLFPLKTVVWNQRLAVGMIRTVANSFGGASPWAGLAMYVAVAAPMLAWLGWRAGRG